MVGAMIEVVIVSKRVSQSFAIKHISFHAHRGEVLSLLGPNGSGKTSIIRLLAGIYRPDAGQVRLAGFDVQADLGRSRTLVGVVTDRLPVYPWLTVMEFLEYCAAFYGLEQAEWRAHAEDLLARFQLSNHRDSPLRTLSNGMKQKLHFIRGTIHRPSILLLDEPTLGLDPLSTRLLGGYIEELSSQGVTVLLCTHDLGFVARVSKRVLFACDGQILEEVDLRSVPQEYEIVVTGPEGETVKTKLIAASIPAEVVQGDVGDLRVRYLARQGEAVHHQVISTLLSIGARVVNVTSNLSGGLEALYAKVLLSLGGTSQ